MPSWTSFVAKAVLVSALCCKQNAALLIFSKPQLESLREFRDGHREQRPVSVPVEMWQLYEEYNVPDTLEVRLTGKRT